MLNIRILSRECLMNLIWVVWGIWLVLYDPYASPPHFHLKSNTQFTKWIFSVQKVMIQTRSHLSVYWAVNTTKDDRGCYKNNIRERYGIMEKVMEGIWRDGLEGDFREQGLPPCVQSRLEHFHRRGDHNLLGQFIPVRENSNAENMLATPGITSLLVNLESMAEKPRARGWGR